MITTTSQAVWTDTTDNTGNAIASGEVVLADNDSETALFTVTNAAPGDSWKGCINVIYERSVSADVVLTNITATGDALLADELGIEVSQYESADCSGMGDLVSTRGDHLGNYDVVDGANPGYRDSFAVPGTGGNRSYGIAITFASSAGNATQNLSTGFSFTWTATSN